MHITPFSAAFFFSSGLVWMLGATIALVARADRYRTREIRLRSLIAILPGAAMLIAGWLADS